MDEQRQSRGRTDEPLGEAQQQQTGADDQPEQPQGCILGVAAGLYNPAFQREENRVADSADQARPFTERIDAPVTDRPMSEGDGYSERQSEEDDTPDGNVESVEEHLYSPTSIGR